MINDESRNVDLVVLGVEELGIAFHSADLSPIVADIEDTALEAHPIEITVYLAGNVGLPSRWKSHHPDDYLL